MNKKYSPAEQVKQYPLILGTFVHRAIAMPFTKPYVLDVKAQEEADDPQKFREKWIHSLGAKWDRSTETLKLAMRRFIDGEEYPLRHVADQAGEEWTELVDHYDHFDLEDQLLMIDDLVRVAQGARDEFLKIAKGQKWNWVHCEVPTTTYRGEQYPDIKRMDLLVCATEPYKFFGESRNTGLQIFDLKTSKENPKTSKQALAHDSQLADYKTRFIKQHQVQKEPQMALVCVETSGPVATEFFRTRSSSKPVLETSSGESDRYTEILDRFVYRAISAPFTKPNKLRDGLQEKPDSLDKNWQRSIETLRSCMEESIDSKDAYLKYVADSGGEEKSWLADQYNSLEEKKQREVLAEFTVLAGQTREALLALAIKQGWRWVHSEVPLTIYSGERPRIKRLDLMAFASKPCPKGEDSWKCGLQIFRLEIVDKIPKKLFIEDREWVLDSRNRFLAQHSDQTPQMSLLYIQADGEADPRFFHLNPSK